jgi:hypothetical protein
VRIAAEDQRAAALDHVTEAERDDHQARQVLCHDQPHHGALHQRAQQGEEHRGDHDRQGIGQPKPGDGVPRHKGAEHVELAVGEVNQARDAEQNGPAERDAGVAGAEHNAVDDLLRDVHELAPPEIVPR